ncbi:AAA family ATPase [Candidatus Woesearchaeota archaeon]|nr:AAA family ATPase [Candidatus Woesearchaeota archaeon]
MEWYTELGFALNPFEKDPFKINSSLIGYEKEVEDLLYLVDAGSTVLIEGPPATGKTTLLKEIIEEFGGEGKIIYVNGDKINKRIDIEELLMKNQNFWRRLMNKKPNGMILLLDNALALPRKSYERLQYYFDQNYLKSVVFATTESKLLKFPGSLFDRIGKRKISTKKLHMDDAVSMVLQRIEDNEFISKEDLEKIYALSDGSIYKFLENCEKIGMYKVENDLEDITASDIEVALKSTIDKEEALPTNNCLECEGQLILIGEHYRCENCDLFCPECGVLVSEDDTECPNCKVEIEIVEDEE